MRLHLKLLIMAASVVLAVSHAAAETVNVERDGAPWLAMAPTATGWTVSGAGRVITITRDGRSLKGTAPSGPFTVTSAGGRHVIAGKKDAVLFSLSSEGRRIVLADGAGSVIMTAKRKQASDGWKVVTRAGEGKVKYYPEAQRVKAKDAQGVERCRMGASGLSLAPAACLPAELGDEHRMLLFGVITALGL